MCDPENEPRYQMCKVCGAKDCDCTERDLRAFQAGAASRDAEVQHLQFALADTEALEIAAGEKIDQLHAELVNALAACKIKDEAIRKLDQLIPVGATIAALATPSDTSALEAMIAKAGEVMRERCSTYVARNLYSNQTDLDAIRALPGAKLEDLK